MRHTISRPRVRKASKAIAPVAPIAATTPRSCRSEVEAATWRMIYERGFSRHILALELIRVAVGIVHDHDDNTHANVARELRNGASLLEFEF